MIKFPRRDFFFRPEHTKVYTRRIFPYLKKKNGMGKGGQNEDLPMPMIKRKETKG